MKRHAGWSGLVRRARRWPWLAGMVAAAGACQVGAQPWNLAMAQLPQLDGGQTTVFYPTLATESVHRQGPFDLAWAANAVPAAGQRRLVVISHGSGGSPWVHADLARSLVAAGHVVAVPQHQGDNIDDPSSPGPDSWARRPREVSQAIDRVAGDPRLAPVLQLDAVGVFGGSAGGHTALSMAGGAWSASRFRDHCLQHMADDFSSCVGFITRLDGSWLDAPKLWLARRVIAWRFNDEQLQRHTDHRVRAVVAMVPFAADFDPASLAAPAVPLGLVTAALDVNQVPRFHAQAVLQACAPRCQVLMHLANGSHGAMLSPLPPLGPGSLGAQLLGDPPGFDRQATLPRLHRCLSSFFTHHLSLPATTTTADGPRPATAPPGSTACAIPP